MNKNSISRTDLITEQKFVHPDKLYKQLQTILNEIPQKPLILTDDFNTQTRNEVVLWVKQRFNEGYIYRGISTSKGVIIYFTARSKYCVMQKTTL